MGITVLSLFDGISCGMVYDYDGCCIYAYYGKIRINNDGKDGKDIDVEAIGYLEGYQEHKEESGAGE